MLAVGRVWLGGVSLQPKLLLRDMPLVLLAGRHRCPVLSGEMVVEKRFCLHVWICPWCKLVTFIAMNDKQQ